MRKLVTIQKITEINPIEGADQIEVATIQGWRVVVKKGDYKVGDLVCYAEIDSVFPELPEFEFLRPNHFRIRSIKLRGQISQGICFPLSVLEGKKYETDVRENPTYDFSEGKEVTGLLGVYKYEPPIPAHLSGMVKGNFPSFMFKTDEERVQNLNPVLRRHAGKVFYYSEKLDGASMTVYLNEGDFGVCTRNLDLKETDNNSLWAAARKDDLEVKLKSYGRSVGVQGELIGNGIQGNKYKLPHHEFRVYNVFDIQDGRYLDFKEFKAFTGEFKLLTVPVLDTLTLNHSIEELLALADGKSILNPAIWREGLVFRPLVEAHDPDLGRLSFKAISNKFLLKYNE